MKKIFFTLLTAVCMSSCVNVDELNNLQNKTWNIQFEETEDNPLPAVAENLTVNWNLVDAETMKIVAMDVKTRNTSSYNLTEYKENISCSIDKDKTYHLIYWVQHVNETGYNIDDLTCIKIDYSNPTRKPAWCGVAKYISGTDKNIPVYLTCPFSVLNVYTENKDIQTVNEIYGNMNDYNYSITVGEVADTYYPLEPEKSWENKKTITVKNNHAYIKTEKRYNNILYNNIVSTSFITEWKQLVNANISLYSEMMEPISFKIDNIPMQQNKTTDIMGRFLTKKITFNVTINPYFEHSANISFD